jgi:hypothetical protein
MLPNDREIPADVVDSLQGKLSGLELRGLVCSVAAGSDRACGSGPVSCGSNWACMSFGMRALLDRAKGPLGKK